MFFLKRRGFVLNLSCRISVGVFWYLRRAFVIVLAAVWDGPSWQSTTRHVVLMRARWIRIGPELESSAEASISSEKSHLEPSARARGSPTWGHPASKPESGRCWDDRATKEGKRKKDRQRERERHLWWAALNTTNLCFHFHCLFMLIFNRCTFTQ